MSLSIKLFSISIRQVHSDSSIHLNKVSLADPSSGTAVKINYVEVFRLTWLTW